MSVTWNLLRTFDTSLLICLQKGLENTVRPNCRSSVVPEKKLDAQHWAPYINDKSVGNYVWHWWNSVYCLIFWPHWRHYMNIPT